MSADTSILPSELIVTPQPLIGLSGLDIAKNPIHKSIWDAFNNNRKNDRAQIQFKLLPNNYEFPVSKPKRQSYEWYHPKGILKRNWMLKHLHVLPAVIVLFQDIEWNDEQWSEKLLQCASMIQSLKNSLQGRNTKIAIFLLQKGAPLPPGDDLLAVERSANLTSKCDINAKMLFVLPYNEHMMGYTIRLESAILELAQSYYSQMAKLVRIHRDQLTSAHQSLRIRHHFKLGFIAEMRLDHSAALKHYTQAYSNVEEIRIVDTNCLELKTVAGFLNYKICRLMFKLTAPREAINTFKNHVDKFKNRTGFKELLFEHYAWLSVQYSSFAELFCDAIKNGLPALQTQHPGIYYHKAAEYIGRRKESFLQCSALSVVNNSQEQIAATAANVFYSDFFGVRGTKLSEPISEQQIIAMVQENEKNYNHSAAIISLLGHAMAQFKLYKCKRFRKKLAIDMAEEYLKCGDHSKALTLYSLMLSDYRIDKWYTIFTEVLLKTLRSAFLSASVSDFIACSIESMSPHIILNKFERIQTLENLWKVFQNIPPLSQNQTAPELKSQWEHALANLKSPVNIDLDKVSDILESVVTFEKPQIKHDENVQLVLYIRSKAEIPLKMQNFQIILTDSKSNYKIKAKFYIEVKSNVDAANHFAESQQKPFTADFMLESEKCYKIYFHTEQYKFTENSELSVYRLDMTMGSDKHYALLTQSTTLNKNKIFKSYNPQYDCMENLKIFNTCYIVPTFHLTTKSNLHNQPMLVNEYFKTICVISNPFDYALQNAGISITVPVNLRNKVFLTTDLTKSKSQKLQSKIQIDIGDIQMQSQTNVQFHLISLTEGNIELLQKLWYQINDIQAVNATENLKCNVIVESPVHKATDGRQTKPKNHNMSIEYIADGVKKLKDDIIVVPCVEEFSLRGRFFTLNKQALLAKAFKNEDFLFRLDLEVRSSCDIEILDMFLICDQNIIEKPYSKQRRRYGVPYKKGQKIRDVKMLNAQNTTACWLSYADFLQNKQNALFQRNTKSDYSNLPALSHTASIRKDDKFKSNLLSKIPINSTIVGSTNLLNSQMTSLNKSFTEENIKSKSTKPSSTAIDTLSNSFHEIMSLNNNVPDTTANNTIILKNVYNKAIDSFHLTDHCRGFLKDTLHTAETTTGSSIWPSFGCYCIRWRRSGCAEENETKLLINGIEIVEPPLNLYCYLDEKMYVKVPMILKITLRNSSRQAMRFKVCLKNSENFMFSGNTQLNIAIYSQSSFDLIFNLYPLKSGWQDLPEFEIKYNNLNSNGSSAQPITTTTDDPAAVAQQPLIIDEGNIELQKLVNRWMPKKVFILPMQRHIK